MKPQPSFLEIVADVRSGAKKLSDVRPAIRNRVERMANDKTIVFDTSHKPKPISTVKSVSNIRRVHTS